MRRPLRPLTAGVVMLWMLPVGACATSSAARRPTRHVAASRSPDVQSLRRRLKAKTTRIRELKAQLALSKAEAEDLRTALGSPSSTDGGPALRGTVRIGAEEEARAGEGEWSTQEPGLGSDPRPFLQLYGVRDPESERLPVAALPDVPSDAAGLTSTVEPPRPSDSLPRPAALERAPDEATRAYRAALRLVRDRKFRDAEAQLAHFLSAFEGHPYAANATFWRGEALYAQRQYAAALQSYRRVVDKWPRGRKAPEALLKMAMCHRRMGRRSEARTLFRRVRAEFPDSVAARLASEEEAG